MKNKLLSDGLLICFDGHCNLCSGWIDFLIKRDLNDAFTFTSLQSVECRNVLRDNGYSEAGIESLSSIVAIRSGHVFTRSDAVIEILIALGGLFKTAIILKLAPSYLRNLVYDGIAKRRYRWFGTRDTCRVPSPTEAHKFLD
ncbi:DCC1-like thiol-disulfide oxidoreductase family protein [Chloroflexi bacterium]|nr:DCC1-like thiol-disulfide oxidoreductase family protein [Chloroflexota bacterium]